MVCDDVGSGFSYSLLVPSEGALKDISIISFIMEQILATHLYVNFSLVEILYVLYKIHQ